jgi:hypothetical protein
MELAALLLWVRHLWALLLTDAVKELEASPLPEWRLQAWRDPIDALMQLEA